MELCAYHADPSALTSDAMRKDEKASMANSDFANRAPVRFEARR
jgi:hypothetical protein